MHTHCKATITPFAAAAAIALAAASAAAAERISSEIEVTPTYELTAEESRHVAHAAARILKHVDQARRALADESHEDAAKNVDQGQRLVAIIEDVMPSYRVTARIATDKREYTDEEVVKPLVVPIYEEIEKVGVLAPVKAAKREEAREQGTGVPVALDVELVNTRAELDVRLAKIGLDEAERALQAEDYDTADTALRTIQTGVTLTYAEVDLPLDLARENLYIAKTLVDQARYDEAKIALEVASEALARYERSVGEARARETEELRAEIDRLAGQITGDDRPDDAANRIESWWDRVRGWFE